MRRLSIFLLTLCLGVDCAAAAAESAKRPFYKASSRAAPMDILSNAYGASRNAPNALEIGDRAPDFSLQRAQGGNVSLSNALEQGPVALIFYRGHW